MADHSKARLAALRVPLRAPSGVAATPTPVGKEEEEWKEMFQRLFYYKQAHNDCKVPDHYQVDPQLAKWVVQQHVQYWQRMHGGEVELDETRIARLETLGFEWMYTTKAKTDPYWVVMFSRLKAWKEKYGDTTIRRDESLGGWCRLQRFYWRKKTIPEVRMACLETLEFDWLNLKEGNEYTPLVTPSSDRAEAASKRKSRTKHFPGETVDLLETPETNSRSRSAASKKPPPPQDPNDGNAKPPAKKRARKSEESKNHEYNTRRTTRKDLGIVPLPPPRSVDALRQVSGSIRAGSDLFCKVHWKSTGSSDDEAFVEDDDNHLGFIMLRPRKEATFADARIAIESGMIPYRLAANLKWLFYIPGALTSHISEGQEAEIPVLPFLTSTASPSDTNARQDGTSQRPLSLILRRAPKTISDDD